MNNSFDENLSDLLFGELLDVFGFNEATCDEPDLLVIGDFFKEIVNLRERIDEAGILDDEKKKKLIGAIGSYFTLKAMPDQIFLELRNADFSSIEERNYFMDSFFKKHTLSMFFK